MHRNIILNSALWTAIISMAFAPAFSQTRDSFDVPTLLREVKQKSVDNWRRAVAQYPNYSYKWCAVSRKVENNGQIKEESELYELFSPIKCRVKKCRRINILLAKNGKPVAAEKIKKQRIEAGKKLERIETNSQAETLALDPKVSLYWMTFGYWVRRPFSEPELVVWIDGQEILEKCEFFTPAREMINGRETIALSFRPRADVVFRLIKTNLFLILIILLTSEFYVTG